MNRYHRYLNLPFEVTLQERIKSNLVSQSSGESKYYPEIYNWLDFLDIKGSNPGYFYLPPNSKLPIHTDGVHSGKVGVDENGPVKINITFGSEQTKMQWFKPKDDNYNLVNTGWYNLEDGEIKFQSITEESCIKLHEANTNRASIVNVGYLHGAYNPSDTGRWTLCVVLFDLNDNLLTWDDTLHKMRDYIDV